MGNIIPITNWAIQTVIKSFRKALQQYLFQQQEIDLYIQSTTIQKDKHVINQLVLLQSITN